MHFSHPFPLQPSQGNVNPDKKDVKDKRKSPLAGENASQAAERIKNAGNQPDLSFWVRKES